MVSPSWSLEDGIGKERHRRHQEQSDETTAWSSTDETSDRA